MSTNNQSISVSGIEVQIVRKDIKNLHLSVYPPDGYVRVSVPRHVTDDNVRLADRKSTRLNSSHIPLSRMPSSA